jgi:O-acetyl-ADP-ribose deacetylase (regulator of RNase III)
MRHIRVADSLIIVGKADITADSSDCVACSTDEHLAPADDVARAVQLSAGREIQQDKERLLRQDGQLEVGYIAVTRPGSLPCRHILHVVSPSYSGGKSGEEKQLRLVLKKVFFKAEELRARSIAVPSLALGYPSNEVPRVYFEVLLEYLSSRDSCISSIRFVNFDSPTVNAFVDEFDTRFPVTSSILLMSSDSHLNTGRKTPKTPNQPCCRLL